MHISKINDEPYSEELKHKILEENFSFLTRAMERSAANPYNWDSTNDKITILFDKDDNQKSGVSLPFTSNVTSVQNMTDYKKMPKLNFIKNIFIGELEYVQAQKLSEFLNQLKKLGAGEIKYKWTQETSRAQNWDKPEDKGSSSTNNKTYKAEGNTLDEKINYIQKLFTASSDFRIDLESYVRVEKRTKKDTEIYTAILTSEKYRGLSGVPGITDRVTKKIQAKVAK